MATQKSRKPGALVLAIAAVSALSLGSTAWDAIARALDRQSVFAPTIAIDGIPALSPQSGAPGPKIFVATQSPDIGGQPDDIECALDPEAFELLRKGASVLDRRLLVNQKGDGPPAEASRARAAERTDVDLVLGDLLIMSVPEDNLATMSATHPRSPCVKALVSNLRAGAFACYSEESVLADIEYMARASAGSDAGGRVGPGTQPDQAAASPDGRRPEGSADRGAPLMVGVRLRESDCFRLDRPGRRFAQSRTSTAR